VSFTQYTIRDLERDRGVLPGPEWTNNANTLIKNYEELLSSGTDPLPAVSRRIINEAKNCKLRVNGQGEVNKTG